MYEAHARALKYLVWFAAGLFTFGIIIEGLKQSEAMSAPQMLLLSLIGLLCIAISVTEYGVDRVTSDRKRDR